MKIDLKISPDQLIATASVLEDIDTARAMSSNEKLLLSIAYDLKDKICQKSSKTKRKTDLFTTGKKVTVSLKFHEAWALEKILIERKSILQNDFTKSMVQTMINLLNQKMA